VRVGACDNGERRGDLALGERLLFSVMSRGDGGVVSPVVTISRCVTFKVPIYLGMKGSTIKTLVPPQRQKAPRFGGVCGWYVPDD
jgi:hypothetical protein